MITFLLHYCHKNHDVVFCCSAFWDCCLCKEYTVLEGRIITDLFLESLMYLASRLMLDMCVVTNGFVCVIVRR